MGKKGGGGGGSPAGDKDAEAVKIVKKGDIRKAEDFFQMNGSCVNACNKKGQTVLMLSVEERMSDISEMLLSLGAKAAQKDRDGKTALHYCIMEEDDITAMDVVKYGGKLSAQDAEGETAIHLAARLATEGSQKIACVLMTPEEYEEEALSGEEEETHRHKVSMPVSNTDVINALRLKDENDSTVLHLAASEADCRELADFIIDKAQTVLGGSSDMLKLVDMKTARGTPFMQACSTGNTPIALKLLSLGASVTSSDEEGVTPLHEACMDGCLELVNAILDHKEPVDLINCQAEDGSTCLHYAAMNGHSSIVKKLVSFEGVNVDPTDAQDETPISLAWIQGKADIVEMLKNAGATTEGLTDDKKAKNATRVVGDTSSYAPDVEKKMVNRKKQAREEHKKLAELQAAEQEEKKVESESKEQEVAERMAQIQENKIQAKNEPQTYELNAATIMLLFMAFTWVAGAILWIVDRK